MAGMSSPIVAERCSHGDVIASDKGHILKELTTRSIRFIKCMLSVSTMDERAGPNKMPLSLQGQCAGRAVEEEVR